MKRAFIAIGPESSGTRLLHRILLAGGCVNASYSDKRVGAADADAVAVHFSLPRAENYDAVPIIQQLKARGYAVTCVFIVRNWFSSIASKVAAGHSFTMAEARAENVRALFAMAGLMRLAPFHLITFEWLNDERARFLLKQLGLNHDASIEPIRDEDTKYIRRSAGDGPATSQTAPPEPA